MLSVFRGVGYFVALQLISRLLSYILNVFVARIISPAEFGVASVHFHLILNSILFLSREGVRRAVLRAEISDAESLRKAINLAWLVPVVGCAVAFTTCQYFLWDLASSETADIPGYSLSVLVVVCAAMIELVSEPVFAIWQNRIMFGARTAVELAAVLARCSLTWACAYMGWGVLSFAVAQLAYAIVFFTGCFGYTIHRIMFPLKDDTFPFTSIRQLFPDRSTHCGLAKTYSKQAMWKFVLAEFEKYALMSTKTLNDQGEFGLVSNLGSLAVRLLFLPVEETSTAVFSRLGATSTSESRQALQRIFTGLARVMVFVGLLFLCFGPAYAHTLLFLLYSSRWSHTSAPYLLAWYCGYVFLLAVNGITEAFAQACATQKQLHWLTYSLVAFSLIHLPLSGYGVTHFGSVGLIFANCLNMCLRICQSLYFIHAYYTPLPLLSMLTPHKPVLAGLLVSAVTVTLSQRRFEPRVESSPTALLSHICVGGAVAVVCLAIFYHYENHNLRQLVALRKEGKDE